MRRNFLLCCILSLISSLTLVHSNDPLYTITAPNIFRPNVPYQLLVSIHQAPAPVDVRAVIKEMSSNSSEERQAEATINSGESKLLQLDVGNLASGIYSLGISGTGGINFNKSASLSHNSKTFSAFIQTDKAIYKPGQIVHFRIIGTNVGLKPYNLNDATIIIVDSQGNRIKQWKNITFVKGIFEGDLQLSDQIVLGDWHIRVDVKDGQYVKYFTIDEYVLPTFEVEVRPPPYATYNDSKIVITVDAKYTYGKPVKGKVLVNVTDYYCKWPCQPYNMHPFTVKTSIDGKADVIVDLVKDLALPDWMRHNRRFEIFASVTEDLTGRTQNGTADITVYESKYKLSFSDSGNFKPGLNYSIILQVSLQDDSPILEENEEISIAYSTGWNTEQKLMNYTIPSNGEITIELVAPDNADNMRFDTSFKGARSSAYVSKAQSLSERYLQVTLLSKDIKIGDEVSMVIDSTKDLNDPLIVQVIGRGRVLHYERVVPSGTKSQEFKFTIRPDMAPKVRVIVYYATTCGEVVADAIDFSVDGVFKTKVELEAKPNSTNPGNEIDINVNTKPNAYVGLLAVDQSVLLLKTGNDLTTKEVLEDLQQYEIGRQSFYSYNGRGGYIMRPWRPPSPTTIQLFSHVGLIFFTNGLLAHIPTYGGYAGYGGGGGIYLEAAPRPAVQFAPQAFVGMAGAPAARPPPPPPPPRTDSLVEPSRVRRYFPETFLWTNATAGSDGLVSIKAAAPDTITSYIITAFAMDDENGLGLSDSPAKLRIFRPFFVTLNLPYSIIRGEAVAIQAIVFNYMDNDLDTEVTLENEDDALDFVELENTVDEEKNTKQLTRTVRAKAGEGTSVQFLVSAKKLDHIDIKVKARSTEAADALIRKLLVKAEGITIYENKAFLIDLRNESSFESKVSIEVPSSVVPESEKVEVSAISDIMGSTINNLDKLLRMPYGCGEQNMLNFVPNIVITEYLTKIGQLNDEIKNKAVKFMESGYQRELTYKRFDGSFSAFGNIDKNGSVWLTAFVVKSFMQARPYITVDDAVIGSSLRWLANLQTSKGSFNESGEVFHKAMQGGSGKGLGLTSYILSAFLEAQASNISVPEFETEPVIRKSLYFLETQLSSLTSDYDLVIATYVLHIAGSDKKDEAFAKMNQRARTERGIRYWSVPLPEVNASDPRALYHRPKSVDVEMTSYALLTYVLRGLVSDSIPIMRWLVSKRNKNGGFESTQDTVMGIQALAKFAATLTPPEGSSLNVDVSYGTDEKKNFVLNKENALILHREQLPRTAQEVTVSATGNGIGIVQVSWSYNVLNTSTRDAFYLTTNVTGENEEINVVACAKYTYETNGESGMAVMEIAFPSGYVADQEGLPKIDSEKRIKRVEKKDGDTVVVIYFDKIKDDVCTSVRAHRTIKVARNKPALVQVYDYYDPLKRAETFYEPPATSICELCDTEKCKQKEKCT